MTGHLCLRTVLYKLHVCEEPMTLLFCFFSLSVTCDCCMNLFFYDLLELC